MGHAHSFIISFVSSANELPVPAVSQLLSAVRVASAWDDATIFPEGSVFPRMNLSWLEGRGYNIHCFEDQVSLGDFLVSDTEISDPEVEINLGGQALELWPKQLFVAEELAVRAVSFFLDTGKRTPAHRWVETGAFPRRVVWEGHDQREAWEHSRRQERDT